MQFCQMVKDMIVKPWRAISPRSGEHDLNPSGPGCFIKMYDSKKDELMSGLQYSIPFTHMQLV